MWRPAGESPSVSWLVMPIFQCLLLASVIVAATLGIRAFTHGIKVSSKSREPITGKPAKIIGSLCLLYAAAVVAFVAWLILTVP